jgi:exodeoxyribonuclease V gamma subunit
VQVHDCHGPARQVEVLHDALLHLLATDRSLEPRDVVVLTPDLATFAPLVEAVFAASDTPLDPDRPRLPASVARPTGTPNDLLRALDALLRLVTARCSAAEVLDLAGYRPVQLALGLEPGDVDLLADWAERAGVRWGLDGRHRSRWALPEEHDHHSWQAAVDRFLAGVAVDGGVDHLTVGGVAPAGWVEGDGVRLAGLAAELVARLGEAIDLLEAPRPVGAWADAVDEVTTRLLAVSDDHGWQRRSLEAILVDLRRRAGVPGADTVDLTVHELRALIASATSSAAPPADVDAGSVTVAELTSLRAVPSRVVCLLGMDQEQLRRPGPDADDLLARDPRVGDPDSRTELRAQLLDAVLAAGQHLVVTRSGRDLRTNRPIPPAIPVAELLEALDLTAEGPDACAASELVVRRHPRQATALGCLQPGALHPERAWSFDPAVLAGAQARRARQSTAFLATPLEPLLEPVVELEALADCVRKPVRSFVRRRLRANLSEDPRDGDTDDLLPLKLDGLDRWSLAHELLDARRHEVEIAAWERHQRATGTLPMGDLADAELGRVGVIVDSVVEKAASKGIALGNGDRVEIEVPLDDGRLLVGEVGGIQEFFGRSVLTHLLVAKLGDRHRLNAWVDLLALTASWPEEAWQALVVGRKDKGEGADAWHVKVAGNDPGATARRVLGELLAFYDRAGRAPLVLPVACGFLLVDGKDAEDRWERWERPDPYHQLVFGDVDFTTLRTTTTVEHDPEGIVASLYDEACALKLLFETSLEEVK